MTTVDSIDVAGVTIDPDHLQDVIEAASENGVPAYQFQGDGPTWIHHVIRAIGDREPLLSALRASIDRLLGGSVQRANFVAANILDERPDLVTRDQLLKGLRRSDLDGRAHAALIAALGANLESGAFAYGRDLRAFDDDSRFCEAVAAVFLFFDHQWYVERLATMSLAEAERRIRRAALKLTNRELAELRSELAERKGVEVVRWLDQEAASEIAEGQRDQGSVRWRR